MVNLAQQGVSSMAGLSLIASYLDKLNRPDSDSSDLATKPMIETACYTQDPWTEIWKNFIAPMAPLIFSAALAWNSIEQRRIARENQSREATKILLQVYESASGLFSKLRALRCILEDQQTYTRQNLSHDCGILARYSASVESAKADYQRAFRDYNNAKLLGLVVYGIHDEGAAESSRNRAKKVKLLLDQYGSQVLLCKHDLDFDPATVDSKPVADDEGKRTRLECLVRAEMDLLNALSKDMRYHLPEPGLES